MEERRRFKSKGNAGNSFSRFARNEQFKDARSRKDLETRRMEEYRKLVKAEGITSSRLEEYDRRKQENKETLQKALDNVKNDEGMTGAEKRKKVHALKKKAATVSAAHPTKNRLVAANPAQRLEGAIAHREAKRQEERDEREARVQEKERRVAQRIERSKKYAMKTKKGQPMMSSRVEALLDKLHR